MDEKAEISVEQAILDVVRSLPPEKQDEVLRHATRLRDSDEPRKPFRSVKGLWADLGVSLSKEEIDEVRREAWGGLDRFAGSP